MGQDPLLLTTAVLWPGLTSARVFQRQGSVTLRLDGRKRVEICCSHHVKTRVLGTKRVLDRGAGRGGCKVASTGGSWSSGCGGSGGEETFAHAVKASAGGVGVVGVLHPRLAAGTLGVKPVGHPGSLALAGQGWPWGATSRVPGRGLRDAVPEGARGRWGNGW